MPSRTKSVAAIAAAVLAFVLAASIAPRGRAQAASVPAVLAGAWTLEGDMARAVRTVDAAFAPVVATLPELLHGFARDRIRNDMAPPRRVEVGLDPARVRVVIASSTRTINAQGALGAHATTTGTQEGTIVTLRLQGGWLEVRYEGEGSDMRQLLSTEADGSRMHLDYTVSGDRIPTPVRFRLDYVRAQ